MNKKDILTLLGFLMFIFGFLSILLSMVGVQLSFLSFLDGMGRLVGFVLKLVMIIGGIILVYLAKSNWQEV